jgi:hypothetical protein
VFYYIGRIPRDMKLSAVGKPRVPTRDCALVTPPTDAWDITVHVIFRSVGGFCRPLGDTAISLMHTGIRFAKAVRGRLRDQHNVESTLKMTIYGADCAQSAAKTRLNKIDYLR